MFTKLVPSILNSHFNSHVASFWPLQRAKVSSMATFTPLLMILYPPIAPANCCEELEPHHSNARPFPLFWLIQPALSRSSGRSVHPRSSAVPPLAAPARTSPLHAALPDQRLLGSFPHDR